ncbi:MAG: hypothetical protein LBK47_00405 [Prevotellaceae bacterium]|jgi:long-subunit fatty acid transport protein|nr:hypothetical protein [Prevotellaceae bacterium]
MKKRLLILTTLLASASAAMAGGLQHNGNQSAEYIRMLSRSGSTHADAIFYNPAGMALFNDGFTISLNNQIPWQTREISCDYPNLQMGTVNGKYEGKVFSALFPGIYAAYKKNSWAFSLGFNPIGGGGASVFKDGLPMLEAPLSTVAQMAGATAYSADTRLEGFSIYYGFQANAAYKINDMFSVAVGLRFVDARNTYDGYMNNIQFNTGADGAMVMANAHYGTLAAQAAGAVAALSDLNATSGSASMAAVITGADAATQLALNAIVAGMPTYDPATSKVSDVYSYYATASANAAKVAGATQDLALETSQHGAGFTPILGFNFHYEKLNIGIRYEFMTKIMLTNDTKKDVMSMFPDGKKTRSDLPAVLSAGAEYMLLPNLRLSGTYTYYFDKDASYGEARSPYVDKNTWEIGLGAEYGITEKLLVSAGYQFTKYNVLDAYETDLTQALSNSTFGFGGAYKFNDIVKLNLGALYTVNEDRKVPQATVIDGLPTLSYNTTYGRHTFTLAFGVDLTF